MGERHKSIKLAYVYAVLESKATCYDVNDTSWTPGVFWNTAGLLYSSAKSLMLPHMEIHTVGLFQISKGNRIS